MITAIVPCYNAERYLGEALESIFGQTRAADEVIVVDDCSTDSSPAIARRYSVQLLRTPVNSGHATARNIGIHAARGDLIAWLDADDCWEPHHLDTVAGLLDRFPEAPVAFSATRGFGNQTDWVWGFPTGQRPANIFWDCVRRTVVPAMTAVTRRATLLDAGLFDANVRVAPDFDLWLRLSRGHLFVSSEQVTARYRQHDAQISNHPARQQQSIYEARWRYLERARSAGDEPGFCEQFANTLSGIWDEELLAAWYARDFEQLRLLLGFSRFVPGETTVSRRLRVRATVPHAVVKAWDALRRPSIRA